MSSMGKTKKGGTKPPPIFFDLYDLSSQKKKQLETSTIDIKQSCYYQTYRKDSFAYKRVYYLQLKVTFTNLPDYILIIMLYGEDIDALLGEKSLHSKPGVVDSYTKPSLTEIFDSKNGILYDTKHELSYTTRYGTDNSKEITKQIDYDKLEQIEKPLSIVDQSVTVDDKNNITFSATVVNKDKKGKSLYINKVFSPLSAMTSSPGRTSRKKNHPNAVYVEKTTTSGDTVIEQYVHCEVQAPPPPSPPRISEQSAVQQKRQGSPRSSTRTAEPSAVAQAPRQGLFAKLFGKSAAPKASKDPTRIGGRRKPRAA